MRATLMHPARIAAGILLAGVLMTASRPAHAELIRYVADSPERHGGTGCSTLKDRRLDQPWSVLYSHIDEFRWLTNAQQHAGPASAAFEAHGRFWLATGAPGRARTRANTAPRSDRCRCRPGGRLSMMIMSAYFEPDQITSVHVHSGREALFMVEGEQGM